MNVIHFFESDDQAHWISEIEKSDWSAGAFLARLLREGTFFRTVGPRSRVLLLADGDELISYCTYAERDDIQPTELTPWVGFVYTFPAHRGRRCAGLLFREVRRLAEAEHVSAVYLSTNHVGLYEKYGFEYLTQMTDIEGNPSRIYALRIEATKEGLPEEQYDRLGFCGVDCFSCPDYVNKICPSCRGTDWKDDPCRPVACCLEKGIALCAFCGGFPCRDMAEFYEESDGHRAAFSLMQSIRASSGQ